jgi:hypothetical protein
MRPYEEVAAVLHPTEEVLPHQVLFLLVQRKYEGADHENSEFPKHVAISGVEGEELLEVYVIPLDLKPPRRIQDLTNDHTGNVGEKFNGSYKLRGVIMHTVALRILQQVEKKVGLLWLRTPRV